MRFVNRLPLWMLVACWAIVGTALPAVSGRLRGVRNPRGVLVHDEATYLIQADTFARGRLTNPSPPHPEFFESPYLLFEPTYQGKYPPAQALFLAVGERLFGRPIWGVWLSSGLFAAALFWMLAGWTNRLWALLGTEFAVVGLGITHPWATTYWGGMVAAAGGAILFGAARWTFRRGTFRRWTGRGLKTSCPRRLRSMAAFGLLAGLGMMVLVNSRPYEGSVVCLPMALVLGCWLLRGAGGRRLEKMAAWGGPCVFVIVVGGAAMAFYNQAVTGSWKTLPYALHPRQYMTCGMFRWQPINQTPQRRLSTRVGRWYEGEGLLNPGRPGGPELGAQGVEDSLRHSSFELFRSFVSPTSLLRQTRFEDERRLDGRLLTVFLLSSAWFVCTTKHWGWLHAAWGLVTLEVLAGGAVWWNLLHYQAPVACLCCFLAVDWLRRVVLFLRRNWGVRIVRGRHVILGFMLIILAVVAEPHIEGLGRRLAETPDRPPSAALLSPAPGGPLGRPQMLDALARQDRPALAVLSYDPGVSLHDEWVYNTADLKSQRVILAHDLGPEKLPLLIADYPGRDVWHVLVTPRGALLERDKPPAPPGTR